MEKVAIIPARGGSKRIPRKNIKSFLGQPIINYPIKVALSSGLFDEVVVSTDDEEIAAIAQDQGARVPFMRSARNADDYATTVDVLQEVLLQLPSYEIGCCIYPTAPLVSIGRLQQALSLLLDHQYNTVFPVVRYSYPIDRSLQLTDQHRVTMRWPENLNVRSQDLPEAYHDAGQFYWFRSAYLQKEQTLYGNNSGAIVLPSGEVQDIDTPEDWQLAELKAQRLW